MIIATKGFTLSSNHQATLIIASQPETLNNNYFLSINTYLLYEYLYW